MLEISFENRNNDFPYFNMEKGKTMKKAMAFVLLAAILLMDVSAFAYDFGPSTIGTGGFQTQVTTVSSGPDWYLNLTKLTSGPAVGVVFVAGTSTWASPLYVFRTTGPRTWPYLEQYKNTSTNIQWRMRKDNDYTGYVTVKGSFIP